MKFFLSLLIASCIANPLTSIAQTKIIAWKMHSGSLTSMDWSAPDNLGLPNPVIDSIFFVNDSTIIEVSKTWGGGYRIVDTVVNHPYCKPAMGLDSIKQYYPMNVTFVGFDSVSKECPPPISCDSIPKIDMKKENVVPGVVISTPGGLPGQSLPTVRWIPETVALALALLAVLLTGLRFVTRKKSVA